MYKVCYIVYIFTFIFTLTTSNSTSNSFITSTHKYPYDPNTHYTYNPSSKITSFSPAVVQYYSNFASMGYCDDWQLSEFQCCNSFLHQERWEIVAHDDINSSFNFHYGIFKSKQYKKIVITVPGTRNVNELINEMINSDLVSFDDKTEMKVLHYFKDAAWSIKDKLFTDLQNVIEDEYQIVFVGHSLGGAVSTILALASITHNVIDTKHNKVVLITYGQPRTGNDAFANEVMKKVSKVIRVVRAGDMVATIPDCIKTFTGNCRTVFDTNYFDMKYEPKEIGFWTEYFKPNLNYWHIGGLVMLNENLSEFTVCDEYQGENFVGECNNHKKLKIDLHTYYLNTDVAVGSLCYVERPKNEIEM